MHLAKTTERQNSTVFEKLIKEGISAVLTWERSHVSPPPQIKNIQRSNVTLFPYMPLANFEKKKLRTDSETK